MTLVSDYFQVVICAYTHNYLFAFFFGYLESHQKGSCLQLLEIRVPRLKVPLTQPLFTLLTPRSRLPTFE